MTLAAPTRRRLRRRVRRRPRAGLRPALILRPAVELWGAIVALFSPEVSFRHTRGPWHRGVVVSRQRRQRRRSSPLGRWLRHGPPGEIVSTVTTLVRRHPLALGFGAVASIWLAWPWLRPPVQAETILNERRPDVVGVDSTDPQRTRAALSIWRLRPKASLVMLVTPGFTPAQSLQLIASTPMTQEQRRRVVVLHTCGDTLTVVADLSRWLKKLPQPGQLTVVTSPDHLNRMLAISQVMLGGDGWRIDGIASVVSWRGPESPLRLIRDQARAQLWRLTGLTGREIGLCQARSQGLL